MDINHGLYTAGEMILVGSGLSVLSYMLPPQFKTASEYISLIGVSTGILGVMLLFSIH